MPQAHTGGTSAVAMATPATAPVIEGRARAKAAAMAAKTAIPRSRMFGLPRDSTSGASVSRNDRWPSRKETARVMRNPWRMDRPLRRAIVALACARPSPNPSIGVMRGASSIEPITTAGESWMRPRVAMAEASASMTTKSAFQREPCRSVWASSA